jgi:hypothetical protein
MNRHRFSASSQQGMAEILMEKYVQYKRQELSKKLYIKYKEILDEKKGNMRVHCNRVRNNCKTFKNLTWHGSNIAL